MGIVFNHCTLKENLKNTSKVISEYYKKENVLPLIIPILNGGVFFFVDLVRELSIQSEMGVISTKLYGEAEKPLSEVKIKFQDASVVNRSVLLVDEICYTGQTLKTITELLMSQGAREVKTVVAVDHIRPGRVSIPTWSVVKYTGDSWVYGYGMDLNGLYRESVDVLE